MFDRFRPHVVGRRFGLARECGFVGEHDRGQDDGVAENGLYNCGQGKYGFPASQLLGSECVVALHASRF